MKLSFDNVPNGATLELTKRTSKKGNTFFSAADSEESHTNYGVARIAWSDELPSVAKVGNVTIDLKDGITSTGNPKVEGRKGVTVNKKSYQAIVRVSKGKAEGTWFLFVSVHPSGGREAKQATKAAF